jgi:hypothetical protein
MVYEIEGFKGWEHGETMLQKWSITAYIGIYRSRQDNQIARYHASLYYRHHRARLDCCIMGQVWDST